MVSFSGKNEGVELMGLMPYLFFSAFLIYLFVIVFIISKNPRGRLNWVCSILLGCLAIWSVSFIFIHNRHVSKQIARQFYDVSALGWCGLPCFVLGLIFIITKKSYLLKKWIIYPFIVVPAVVILYVQWAGLLVVEFSIQNFGWGIIIPQNKWQCFYSVYLLTICGVALFIFEEYRKKIKNNFEKRKVLIVFFFTMVPIIIVVVTDVIFPILRIPFPNIGALVGLSWVIVMIYFATKYNTFTITSKLVAEDIIETMADSLVLVSPEKKIILINPGTLELLGYSREELISNSVNMIFDEEDGDVIFEGEIFEELINEGYVQSYDVNYKTKSGERIPVNFSGSTVKSKNGVLMGTVFISRDMRDIIKLIKKEKELAIATVSAKTDRLKTEETEKAYKKLKDTQNMLVQSEKLRELGEIGAGVVHELNNPLSGIILLMRIYKKRKQPGTKEYEDLDEMEKGCEFMATIIRGLGDFTRESSGKFVKLNCNVIVDSILSFLTIQLENKNIRIIRDYDEELPYVYGNRHQLQQIVISMINNAKDALSGKGFLAVRTRTVKTSDNVFVEIEFEDSGCGIGKDIIDKVFDPFFTTKMPGQGVGLGLSVAHSIIKAHKGEISVESKEGNGSVFTIRVPALN